eukprot:760377-Pleurochrysis_carterae.AAC.3
MRAASPKLPAQSCGYRKSRDSARLKDIEVSVRQACKSARIKQSERSDTNKCHRREHCRTYMSENKAGGTTRSSQRKQVARQASSCRTHNEWRGAAIAAAAVAKADE